MMEGHIHIFAICFPQNCSPWLPKAEEPAPRGSLRDVNLWPLAGLSDGQKSAGEVLIPYSVCKIFKKNCMADVVAFELC